MNKYKALHIIIIFLTVHFMSQGQQVPFYNHNVLNPFIFNPAQAGQSGDLNAFLVRNERFNGFGGAAVNNYLSLEGGFFVPNSGFGLVISNFSHGIQQQINGQFSYAYSVKFNEDNDLSFGVAVGYLENHLNNSAIDVVQIDDPYLEGLRGAAATYDFNAGISYRFKNTRIGAAVPQLIGNKVDFVDQSNRGYYALARHFMGTLEHDFFFLDNKLRVKPHALVRYVEGAPIQYDGTLFLEYNNFAWLSATYKSDYAVQFNAGIRLMNSLSIGYSYEYVYGTINNFLSGFNHEFLLGYRIPSGKEDKRKIMDLTAENEKLKVDLKKQEEENEELRQKLKQKLKESLERERQIAEEIEAQKEPEYGFDEEELKKRAGEIRDDKFYNFVELDGSKAANGYYVISGVFSEEKNKTKQLAGIQVDFPDAYVVKNTINGYFYVVVDLSQSKEEAFFIKDIFQESNPESSVWMLNYRK